MKSEKNEVRKLGNIYGFTGGNFAGSVWDKEGISPTISTMQGGGQEPMIVQTVAMRGRGEPGHIEQNLEIRGDIANTLTSVEKDNLVMEIKMPKELNKWVWEINGTKYLIRIRKLTPRECWRLMTFSDEDFDKAASVNSNTQLYKQAGNAIVKDVIADIIRQLM
ncbi:MAG: DNA cytosine methyltransferase [Lachnospiraceae bacterium]|nr:DNA cytosine methyltransferase [Lachnospiraceae bacterium]